MSDGGARLELRDLLLAVAEADGFDRLAVLLALDCSPTLGAVG